MKAKRIPPPSSHPPALRDARSHRAGLPLQPRLACHGQGQRQAGACRRQLGRRAGGVHPSSHPIFASATRPQDYSTHGKRSIETKHNIVPQPIQHARTPTSTAPAIPLLARAASPASAQDAPLVIRPPARQGRAALSLATSRLLASQFGDQHRPRCLASTTLATRGAVWRCYAIVPGLT